MKVEAIAGWGRAAAVDSIAGLFAATMAGRVVGWDSAVFGHSDQFAIGRDEASSGEASLVTVGFGALIADQMIVEAVAAD